MCLNAHTRTHTHELVRLTVSAFAIGGSKFCRHPLISSACSSCAFGQFAFAHTRARHHNTSVCSLPFALPFAAVSRPTPTSQQRCLVECRQILSGKKRSLLRLIELVSTTITIASPRGFVGRERAFACWIWWDLAQYFGYFRCSHAAVSHRFPGDASAPLRCTCAAVIRKIDGDSPACLASPNCTAAGDDNAAVLVPANSRRSIFCTNLIRR